MTPLVSILIPAYNAQEWLAQTLLFSPLEQTWANTEIIVVDDGSSDQTLAVARQFQSKRVRVVSQENQGAAAARNRCFSLSQGEYIQWLDADDLLGPKKISRQMAVRNQGISNRTPLSAGWARFVYRPNRAQFVATALWRDLSPVEWLTRKLELNLHMQTATWLVSRELTEAVEAIGTPRCCWEMMTENIFAACFWQARCQVVFLMPKCTIARRDRRA